MLRNFSLAALVFLAGCASTSQVAQVDRLESVAERPRILLMPPDVKYYVLTAGGLTEPQADWTAQARVNFTNALTAYAAERDADVVQAPASDDPSSAVTRYEKLHAAVGSTILINHFGVAKLPTKAGQFDWGLGAGVSDIREQTGADYALFSFYRDYQASGGRIAFAVLAAAAGVGVSTTAEFGFASLVDLKTGDIVWFNKVDVGSGELRDSDGAMTVIRTLFKGLPAG